MNSFLSMVTSPFGNNRAQEPARPPISKEHAYKGPAVPERDPRRWSIWAAGYGGQNNASGDLSFGVHERSARTYGYATGLDEIGIFQRGLHRLEMTGQPQIVVALVANDTPLGLAQHPIAMQFALLGSLGHVEKADAPVVRPKLSYCGAHHIVDTIANNQDFDIVDALRLDAGHREWEGRGMFVCRDQNGNARHEILSRRVRPSLRAIDSLYICSAVRPQRRSKNAGVRDPAPRHREVSMPCSPWQAPGKIADHCSSSIRSLAWVRPGGCCKHSPARL
jgi:hypothetical protein